MSPTPFWTRSVALATSFFLATMLVQAVGADNINVQNEIDANGGDTVLVGASTSIGYKITATGGSEDQGGCNADDGSPAIVSILAPSPVVAVPSSLTFSACQAFQQVLFSSAVAGNYTIDVSATDAGGGVYKVESGRFVLHVQGLPPPPEDPDPVDATAPSILAHVSHGAAPSGWYNLATGAPTVSFECADDVLLASCSDPVTLGEGAGQTVVGVAVDAAGNNASVSAGPFDVDLTPPSIEASASRDAAESGWYNIATGAPTISFTCDDALSGIASCSAPALLGEGLDQGASGSAVDLAGNEASASLGGLDVDLTAPSITSSLSHAAAASGWYNLATGPPTASFECFDALSGIASCSGPVLLGEGAGQSASASAVDHAGNALDASTDPVDIDLTSPSISAAASPADAGNGWYNGSTGPPTVSFTCDDALSGIASCSEAVTLGEGTNQSVAGSARDAAGNEASASLGGLDVDLTSPVLGLPASFSVFATAVGGGPASFAVSASDNLDPAPALSCSAASGDVFPLGATVVTCTARDAANNTASGSFSVTVRYNAQGFFQPVKENKLNVVKAGSTVPLKFAIRAPGGGFIGDLAAVVEFRTQSVPCAPLLADPIQFTTTGGTSLRYDATANQFIQNWQTPKEKGCVRTSVELADGTVLSALFQLK